MLNTKETKRFNIWTRETKPNWMDRFKDTFANFNIDMEEAELIKKSLLTYKGKLQDETFKGDSVFANRYLGERIDKLTELIQALDAVMNEFESVKS